MIERVQYNPSIVLKTAMKSIKKNNNNFLPIPNATLLIYKAHFFSPQKRKSRHFYILN